MKADRETTRVMPDSADIVRAMRDLEDDIHGLGSMTHILSNMLDDALVELRPGERVRVPEPGGLLTVRLGHQELELLCFAWNDVTARANRLLQKFEAACEGKAVAS